MQSSWLQVDGTMNTAESGHSSACQVEVVEGHCRHGSMRNLCVAIYMNLGPYHIARLRALNRVHPALHVVEIAGTQDLYPWRPERDSLGFSVTTLFPNQACESIAKGVQCDAVRDILSRLDPAVVIVAGYRESCMRAATQWACAHGRSAILQFVSTYRDHPRTWWKEFLKTRLMKRHAFVAATGMRAEQYALQLGMSRDRIYRIGNVVDNDHYAARSQLARQESDRVRGKFGLPSRYFLTVARLSPEKNLLRLLTAFNAYRDSGGEWDLVVVGSGAQEGELRSAVAGDRVHWVPWKPYDELPYCYGLASCFVLASLSEPWGLVVNEAMASGLPVLVSQNCGCVPELCRVQENGYTFDPMSAEELKGAMLRISSGDTDLSAFGRTSREIITSFTPGTWAGNLKKCITAAASTKARQ